MLIRQLFASIRRRPLVALVGIVLTGILVFHVHGLPGVYRTEVGAIFVTPEQSAADPSEPDNPLDGPSPSLISAAGVIARMLNGGEFTDHSGSDAISLAGQGVTDGYSITLPNSGGQWVFQFERPMLTVQAVGHSEAQVEANLDGALAQIQKALTAREDMAGVPESQRIRIILNPAQPLIIHGLGDPKRAMLGAMLLGGLLTCVGLQIGQGSSLSFMPALRRRSRRQEAPATTTSSWPPAAVGAQQ